MIVIKKTMRHLAITGGFAYNEFINYTTAKKSHEKSNFAPENGNPFPRSILYAARFKMIITK